MSEEFIRFIASFTAGSLMSLMGSFIQLRSQNILASTSTIGLDSLSVLWILLFHSFAILFNIEIGSALQIGVGILVFIFLGIQLGRIAERKFKLQKLIIIGIALNLFVGALYSLWQFLFLAFNFEFPTELLFGHFRFVSLDEVLLVLLLLFIFLFVIKRFWRELEIYSTGEEISKLAGINYQRMTLYMITLSSVGIFLLISLFGGFSFLGLVLPIVSRGLWFPRFGLKGEFIIGGLINGLLFMLIDFVCYSFPVSGAEIPVGLLSGVVGSLTLISILTKQFSNTD